MYSIMNLKLPMGFKCVNPSGNFSIYIIIFSGNLNPDIGLLF